MTNMMDLMLDQRETITVKMDRLIPESYMLYGELKMTINQEMKLYSISILIDSNLKMLFSHKLIPNSYLETNVKDMDLKWLVWDHLCSLWQCAKVTVPVSLPNTSPTPP